MLALAVAVALPAAAVAIAPTGPAGAPRLAIGSPVFHPSLLVGPSLTLYGAGTAPADKLPGLQAFTDRYGSRWEVRWDDRSDRPHLIQGSGVPLIAGGAQPALAEVERLLRDFMAEQAALLRVDPAELVLDRAASGPAVPDGSYWNVEFQQTHRGLPVEGARVFFRVNHGNIVQFGTDGVADVAAGTVPTVSREQAQGLVLAHYGLSRDEIAALPNPGSLRIYPALGRGEGPGELYGGARGAGYRHLLAWQIDFRRAGDDASYRAIVDARSGELLQVIDTNSYANAVVDGGIYPVTNTDAEVVRGFPYANVTNGGTKTTDANGVYDYSGGTATVTLNGRYTRISDNCGAISLSNATDGNLHFLTSGGDDCVTPGVGGAGNTHSARTGFYHLTQVNRVAIGYLPGNAWLNGTLTANMNINNTCNAFWNGSTVNFYRSGGGCSNTGEISGVFIHEWGHGLDSNTGTPSPDNGTGEALADTFAFTYNGDACIGNNFTPGNPCPNCRASCTGVRDVDAFSQGGISTIASPANVTANGGINCDIYGCPFIGYLGPMGYEGHCESYIASTANWDLSQSIGLGTFTGLWYGGVTTNRAAYRVVSGGQCNPNATVDGCASNNWYSVLLAVDDDNGDLSDGTPHICEIWEAYNAHGIACGDRPEQCGCTPDEPDGEVTCDDGKDNDCDGLTDQEDPDCEGCGLVLVLRNREVHAGDPLTYRIGLEHNRLLTVNASFKMWIEDAFGNVVVGQETSEYTLAHGDRIGLEFTLTIPPAQAPGEYKLIVAIGEMNQGVATRERAFSVIP